MVTTPRDDFLSIEERALVEGGEALDEFISCDNCAVIDWRGEFEEIVDAFASNLPDGYVDLAYDTEGDPPDELTVTTKNGVAVVPLEGRPPWGLELAAAIASVLPPEYEAHAFASTLDSDTHCYLVRPRAWWQQFRRAFPGPYGTVFADDSKLPSAFRRGDLPGDRAQ